MNDRIKQLAKQVYGTQATEQEIKFAELIIREAADIATMNQHQWHCPGTYVLKHFGIDQ
jgi:hypothetical protein